jgi:hypothetical protein
VPPSAAFGSKRWKEATPLASEHNVTYVSFVPKRREIASERFVQRVSKIRARGQPRFLEELDAKFEGAPDAARQQRASGAAPPRPASRCNRLGRDRREQLLAHVGEAERRSRSSSKILPLLRAERPTFLCVLPAALFAVVRDHAAARDDFASIRLCVSGRQDPGRAGA